MRLKKLAVILNTSFIVCLFLSAASGSFAQTTTSQNELDKFNKNERVLILAPHPDDESIACAGVIQEALANGAKVKIAFLTNGEHNEFAFIVYNKRITIKKNEFIRMGKLRRKEAVNAVKILGVKEGDLSFLGYPDFGTFSIFNNYWDLQKPFKSLLTRISKVPYPDGFSPGALYVGENILADLKRVILDYRPDKIFVSHPADVNVDHKTFYLFLQIALADLKGKIKEPKIYPYLVHHVGWPLPRHYHPQLELNPPEDLKSAQINWMKFRLNPEQLNNKYKAVLCHRSQTASSAFYLLSFVRLNELFGDYPVINLKGGIDEKQSRIKFFILSKVLPNAVKDKEEAPVEETEGVSRVTYSLEKDFLVIKIEKPTNLVYRFSTMNYIFGYKYGAAFAAMPKVRIITKHDRFKVFNGKKIIKPEGMIMDFSAAGVILKIPLDIIGNPDFILTAARVYIGKGQGQNSPVFTTGFRKIILK